MRHGRSKAARCVCGRSNWGHVHGMAVEIRRDDPRMYCRREAVGAGLCHGEERRELLVFSRTVRLRNCKGCLEAWQFSGTLHVLQSVAVSLSPQPGGDTVQNRQSRPDGGISAAAMQNRGRIGRARPLRMATSLRPDRSVSKILASAPGTRPSASCRPAPASEIVRFPQRFDQRSASGTDHRESSAHRRSSVCSLGGDGRTLKARIVNDSGARSAQRRPFCAHASPETRPPWKRRVRHQPCRVM
jgi:hypothetical protein